jgi:RNA-binding protein YhbY
VEESGISLDVWADLERELNDKETIQIKSGKRERKIRITDDLKDELKTNVFGKITFLMVLFKFLAQESAGQPETDGTIASDVEEEQLILDIIDTKALGAKYADALKYFQNNLWHENFSPTIRADVITRLKTGGLILLKGPRDGTSLVFISWAQEPLQSILTFLEMLGKTAKPNLLPVFSPEEEAFAPYLDLLGMVQSHLVTQDHLRPVISKALSNFSESNFTDAVSSIGLAAEDVLTQVFETLFRDQLNKGLTLGQLLDEIHSRAGQVLVKKEDSPPDLASLFPDIKKALETEATDQKHGLEVMRRMLAQVIESNKHLHGRIDKIGRVERRVSVFPDKVAHLLTELIRFRNAASHRSRIPIGPYECRRSAYAFVVLYTWWDRERKAIDWTKPPREILLDCIHRNAAQT